MHRLRDRNRVLRKCPKCLVIEDGLKLRLSCKSLADDPPLTLCFASRIKWGKEIGCHTEECSSVIKYRALAFGYGWLLGRARFCGFYPAFRGRWWGWLQNWGSVGEPSPLVELDSRLLVNWFNHDGKVIVMLYHKRDQNEWHELIYNVTYIEIYRRWSQSRDSHYPSDLSTPKGNARGRVFALICSALNVHWGLSEFVACCWYLSTIYQERLKNRRASLAGMFLESNGIQYY